MQDRASSGASIGASGFQGNSSGSSGSSAGFQGASQGIKAALESMSELRTNALSNKEKKRQRKARLILELLRNRLSSENETRESQNAMKDAFADLLSGKAAQFRQAVS
jgi:flagellar basal body-associated protein FliL